MEKSTQKRYLWIRRSGDDALFGAFRAFCSEILGVGLDTLPGPPLDHGSPAAYVSGEVELVERMDALAQHGQAIVIPLGDGADAATMISFMLVRCVPARPLSLRFLANGRASLSGARNLLGLMKQPRDLAVPPSCIAPYLTHIDSQNTSVEQEFGFMRVLSDAPRGEAYRCVYVLQLFLGAVCHDLKNTLAAKLGRGLSPLPEIDERVGGVTFGSLPALIRSLPVVEGDKALLSDFASALDQLKGCCEDSAEACLNTLKATHIYRRFKNGISTASFRAG